MNDVLSFIVTLSVIFVIAVILSYNRFVNQKNLIANSWSNIDTELRRRYDLIPNLVETVKGYAAHERAVLEQVVAARTKAMSEQGSPEAQAGRERPLVDALKRLLAVVENYPQLKANEHYLELQEELVDTEDRIQAARRFYNANVRDYNTRVQSLPSNLIARIFNFEIAGYFQIEPAVRPEVERAPTITPR